MTSISIHTVYKPQENVLYLREWLEYNLSIGVDKFYIYDNADSMAIDHFSAKVTRPDKNKYGYQYRMTIEDARKIQDKIISDYNVELITWSPIDDNGLITYGQVESMNHLSSIKDSGLVAFIDVDEFIIKREDFRPSRLLQVKYEHRNNYDMVTDISNGFAINTERWAPKCIVDMAEYVSPTDIHFPGLELPLSRSFFNHYNYNEVNHNWLLDNYLNIDSSWVPKEYSEVFIKMPTLKELTGFDYTSL